jgi:hypothetical protein
VDEESQPGTEGIQILKIESQKANRNDQNNIDKNGQNNDFQTEQDINQSSTEFSQTYSCRPERSTKEQVPDRNADCLVKHNKDSVGFKKVSTDSEMDPRTDQTSKAQRNPEIVSKTEQTSKAQRNPETDPRTDQTSTSKAKPCSILPGASSVVLGSVKETDDQTFSSSENDFEYTDDVIDEKFSGVVLDNDDLIEFKYSEIRDDEDDDDEDDLSLVITTDFDQNRTSQHPGPSGVSSNVDRNSEKERQDSRDSRQNGNSRDSREIRVDLHKLNDNDVKRWTEPKAAKKRGLLPGCKGGPDKKRKKLSNIEAPNIRVEKMIKYANSNGSSIAAASNGILKKARNNALWKYFKLGSTKTHSKKRDTFYEDAICKVKPNQFESCGQVLRRTDGSTAAMRGHLKSVHPETFYELLLKEKVLPGP